MYEVKVSVSKVLGVCSAHMPMKPGDYITVRDGDLRIPEGGHICAWALQSLMPLLTTQEREIAEAKEQDWVWRVHHAQCPDPKGRVIFHMERVAAIDRTSKPAAAPEPLSAEDTSWQGMVGRLPNVRIIVEEVRGHCTSGMQPGNHCLLRGGSLFIPAGRHFCLYALQATLPFLAAKQRSLEDDDWLKRDAHIICPDPAGNVILRIETSPRPDED